MKQKAALLGLHRLEVNIRRLNYCDFQDKVGPHSRGDVHAALILPTHFLVPSKDSTFGQPPMAMARRPRICFAKLLCKVMLTLPVRPI